MDTLARIHEHCDGSAGPGLTSLYGLYPRIANVQISAGDWCNDAVRKGYRKAGGSETRCGWKSLALCSIETMEPVEGFI